MTVNHLTTDELETLRTAVTNKLFTDNEHKNPKDWAYLKMMIKKKTRFDFIIDGLNVAYHDQSGKSSVLMQAKTVIILAQAQANMQFNLENNINVVAATIDDRPFGATK